MVSTDVVIDLQYGDTGKGKVVYSLLKDSLNSSKPHEHYTHCMRFSAGANAGHTIYHNKDRFATHIVPAGIFFNIKSFIGNNCVVHPESFLQEIEDLQNQFNKHEDLASISIKDLVKIDKNAFIVTKEHLEQDGKDSTIGTTKRGIGPAIVSKYARNGIQAFQVSELKPFLTDIYEELLYFGAKILGEGAQGFYLDPHFGEMPYVTSNHCTAGTICLNGIPPKSIDKIYGTAKAYETYVGTKSFQPKGKIFDDIADLGKEFGVTTGRRRQVNYLNLDALIKAININGVTDLIINKIDILDQLNHWAIIDRGNVVTFSSTTEFRLAILNRVSIECDSIQNSTFSENPYVI